MQPGKHGPVSIQNQDTIHAQAKKRHFKKIYRSIDTNAYLLPEILFFESIFEWSKCLFFMKLKTLAFLRFLGLQLSRMTVILLTALTKPAIFDKA